jgi:predicted metal-dependent HD superfamily phosphohydrolase
MNVAKLREIWGYFSPSEHFEWTWEVLHGAYSSRGRHYHCLDHVEACLDLAGEIDDPRVDLEIVRLALFWHDAVYVPGNRGNETMSAELLGGVAGGLDVDRRVLNFAQHCIRATRHDEAWMFAGNPTVDAVVDVDLSILGQTRDVYDHYVFQVRIEHAAATDEQWNLGRSAFLRAMLKRERVFLTEWARARFEGAARANMTRELCLLSSSSS